MPLQNSSTSRLRGAGEHCTAAAAATDGCSHACPRQAALLAAQVVWVYWYCLALYWSPSQGSGAARAHLRAFAALKSLSFVFSALQLRSGYPPPASYQCGPLPQPAPNVAGHASKLKKLLPVTGGSTPVSSVSSGALWCNSWIGVGGPSSSTGLLHTVMP